MRLILVRHALPERVDDVAGAAGAGGVDGAGGAPGAGGAAGVSGASGAPADPGLTELGHRQAARLVTALDGEPVDALYTSTLRRAVQTAAPLAAARGLTPVPVADLREFDAEQSAYVPIGEMARADPRTFARMRAGHLPEHVDAAAFAGRVHAAVEEIVATHPGRATVVVVAHAGVVNSYLAGVLGTGRPLPFPLDYAGISRLVCARDGMRRPRTVNEIAHVADLLD